MFLLALIFLVTFHAISTGVSLKYQIESGLKSKKKNITFFSMGQLNLDQGLYSTTILRQGDLRSK